jgi:hypothetical protein
MVAAGLVLGLVLVVGFAAYIWIMVNSFGDCGPPERSASSALQTIRLDADHPVVEQRIAVSITCAPSRVRSAAIGTSAAAVPQGSG